MIHAIPPQDENNTDKYPVIFTFDKGTVWLKRRGKPARKITAWAWAAIAAMFLILFNPFLFEETIMGIATMDSSLQLIKETEV